jgi:hypothetical protein
MAILGDMNILILGEVVAFQCPFHFSDAAGIAYLTIVAICPRKSGN